MADPTIVAAAAVAAPLLDKVMSSLVSQVVALLGQRASKALQDADKQLQTDAASRAARMAAIVQQAGQAVAPELARRQIEPAQGIIDLFEIPDFLAQVSAALLFGGWPDLESLRLKFQQMFPNTSWEELEQPLNIFYHHLQSQLRQDDVWKDILGQFELAAKLNKIDATTLRIAELAQEAVAAGQRTADATERTADASQRIASRQEAEDTRQQEHLNALERRYLRNVFAECNGLPLAGDAPPDASELHRRRPRLQRVYVDLHVHQMPTARRVLDRIGASGDQRDQIWQLLFKSLGELPNEHLAGSRASRGSKPARSSLGRITEDDILVQAVSREQFSSRGQNEQLKELGIDIEDLVAAMQLVTVFEALRDHGQMVLLGDPGSGKSTLTRRLAGTLAASQLEPGEVEGLEAEDTHWQERLPGAFDRWLLPVRIVLSRWAAHLPEQSEGTASDLLAECKRILRKTVGETAIQDLEQRFLARLTGKQPSVLLLLDGLDEVSDLGQRTRLLAAVRDFCVSYGDVPLLVTCRIRPYQDKSESYRLDLPDQTLAPLSDVCIGDFLRRWHEELVWAGIYEQGVAEHARRRLQEAIDDRLKPELRTMAGTPLLLTMMARVNYSKGLPDSRAMLYEAYVEQLLWEWERAKLDEKGQPTQLENLLRATSRERADLEQALDKLAYAIHGQPGSRDRVEDIPSWQMRAAVEQIHPGPDEERAAWAVKVLALIDDRSGLINLLAQGQVYQFSHRTFQEYLAARWLANGDFLGKYKARIDDENWREAVLLALGYQIFKLRNFAGAVTAIHELLPEQPACAADWQRVLLLGEAYVRLLTPQRARQADAEKAAQQLEAAMPSLLTAAMQNPALPARQRLEAGLLLSDPVTGPAQGLDLDPPGLDDFIPVPGAGFRIGRYPVTNRQFKRFVDDDGYDTNKPWWTTKAVTQLRSYWGDDWRRGPRYWDDNRLNRSSQPAVGVSWYETTAYCAWLTGKLRAEGAIDDQHEARLPTVDEWQQAAGSERYPWGKTFDAANANTKENGLEQTTPVHMYPGGRTATGISDLAGNVWEWTKDLDKTLSFEAYILIGGAWYMDATGVSSAARLRRDPWYRSDGIGLRVVVVPISRG